MVLLKLSSITKWYKKTQYLGIEQLYSENCTFLFNYCFSHKAHRLPNSFIHTQHTYLIGHYSPSVRDVRNYDFPTCLSISCLLVPPYFTVSVCGLASFSHPDSFMQLQILVTVFLLFIKLFLLSLCLNFCKSLCEVISRFENTVVSTLRL